MGGRVIKRQNVQVTAMQATTTRATIYFDRDVHRTLRLKAAETHRFISEIVSDAVREALREDAVVCSRSGRERRINGRLFIVATACRWHA